jgi:hypothetical protein
MAKITAQTQDGFLVEMSNLEAKRVFADATIQVGKEANLAVIYGKLIWLKNNLPKFRSLGDSMRNMADNLDAALDISGVENGE